MNRPNIHEYMLDLTDDILVRSTCVRRRVGAVITDEGNHILSTGYNGTPRGAVHCTDEPCYGALASSGEQLDQCGAIHAEQNAIGQCHSIQAARNIYVSVSPCMSCMKSLLATQINHIFTKDIYDGYAVQYWLNQVRSLTVI